MDQRGVFFASIVCLLISLAVASEPGPGQSRGKRDTFIARKPFRSSITPFSREKRSSESLALTGSHEPEPSLLAAPASSGWVTNITGSSGVVGQDEVVPEHVPGSRGERERVERTDNESQVEQEQEVEEQEDYEGEDEYEDELKAVVESHEAMSRDDTRNSNAFPVTSSKLADETSTGPANNFESHEVITADNSDEDVASNEAITDEFVDKYDQEVAELLKYKKARNSNQSEGGRTKTKRVPTVKKELSTQKEILIGSNETQVPKSLLPPEDPVNRLNEETEAIRRRNVDSDKQIKSRDSGYSEKSAAEVEVAADNRYSESEAESPKKLDKRQETVLKDLKSYLLTEYATEEEQRQKLRQLGAEKDALAENVLKLLVKLAENPNRWERVQQLLLNTENDLNLSKNAIEPSKRSYESSSTLFPDTPQAREDSRKSRKKLKKKKKKPKHRFSTTTLTPVPATPPLLTTTETPWQTTPVQWRLVAERLFAPPWQEQTEKTTNTRHSVPQSPRTLSSIRDLIERSKPKSNLKSFPSDRKATITEDVGELADQRLMRFGNVGSRQVGRIEPHGEFVNVYDRPADPERIPDYDVPYHQPRYNQLPPGSHEFLHRHEEDYQSDSSMPVDTFGRGQDYEGRDFSLSKSWPDILRYNAPWKAEERPMIPVAYDKWPWRQPQPDPKYWPQRASYLPLEKSYWSPYGNEYEPDEEAEAAKIWEEQRAQHSWDRERPWPQEKPMKMPPYWQQVDRPAKVYDREQPNGTWEKSKNRSELTRSKESKEKVVLPQITMKTWNSLTSDPATWPHKLPGAKPWPKDENGKSYNPNADLVKKLGLDKQNGAAWSKDEVEKSSAERKLKEDKQNRLFAKDSVKSEEILRTEVSKYKSNDERNNFSDNKGRSSNSGKPWTMLADKSSKDWMKSEDVQADDSGAWRRKYEGKNSWSEDATLPKIQSVGAWVMAADQSTWKPYQIKPLESSDDIGPRRWPKARSNKGSWEKNDSWMDHANVPLDLWPGKSNKGSWFAKTKDTDGWTSKSNSPDSWKAKGEWSSKPESSSWISKTGDNDSWPSRGNNGGSWSTKGNESWTSKINDDGSKFNGDPWTSKTKEEDSVDAWSRKSNEQNGWGSKSNDLTPWQQKMNDEWNYGKSSSTGTWPAKWKQFAYHRVTAMPISKPGTTSDANSSKSKNAFVAVSAVSSPKYTGNEWRKNEEERNENGRQEEQERSSNQVQVELERPIYAWKKDSGLRTASTKSNATDPLENQLEALRQIDFWAYKENEAEKRLTSTNASTETTSMIPRNSTSTGMQRRSVMGTGNSNDLSETNRRAISMK
ncbi:uncharacterized protein LOC100876062 isoform X2 [Megachile rotundata]|uniref:uncharacterized protein LOC100876062 isoform X2 n=1 Tax=Megachile rotundata TaxID=143995 RepID=UPI003FD33DAE